MLLAQCGATFAGHFFHTRRIGDRDFPAAVLNEALLLQCLCQQRDRGSPYAKSRSNPILRGVECLRPQSLTALRQPAAQALLRGVDRVAAGNLLRLCQQPIAAEMDEPCDLLVGPRCRKKLSRRNANEVAAGKGTAL